MTLRLVPASRAHVGPIANRMREADRRECAAFGYAPKAALRRSLAGSTCALTALVDGRPEAMMGVEVLSALDRSGTIWMLATDEAFRHGRAMLRLGPIVIDALADSTRHLSNLVSSDNAPAIRMLRRWGFDVSEEVTMIGNAAFHAFRMDR